MNSQVELESRAIVGFASLELVLASRHRAFREFIGITEGP